MRSPRLGLAAIGGALVVAMVAMGVLESRPRAAALRPQPPAFRVGTDLIAVDVQVVDKNGAPILDLTPADFTVSFNGKPRRVVSADLLRYGQATTPVAGPTRAEAPPAPMPAVPPAPATAGRYIILAIDNLTFDVAQSRGVAQAAQGFVDRLAPADEVGLYTYPLGPKLDPTTDRAEMRTVLGQVMGERHPEASSITLSPSDIVDVSAGDGGATFERLCGVRGGGGRIGGGVGMGGGCHGDSCQARVTCEASRRVMDVEGEASASLGMLGTLLRRLGDVSGQKIVVLVSAGMVVSDRPDGRPDLGNLPEELGRQAAQSDVTLYTLFLDQGLLEQGAAENAHGLGGSNAGRDSAIMSRWLDLFSGSAGGTLLTDLIGSGDEPYDRILRETSVYYLLGVQPDDTDRDGHAHELRVKVNRRSITVRSRAWAVVPKRAN